VPSDPPPGSPALPPRIPLWLSDRDLVLSPLLQAAAAQYSIIHAAFGLFSCRDNLINPSNGRTNATRSAAAVFVWLVCLVLLADCYFILREKFCWLVTDKSNKQGTNSLYNN
jgi:hypothetical protein